MNYRGKILAYSRMLDFQSKAEEDIKRKYQVVGDKDTKIRDLEEEKKRLTFNITNLQKKNEALEVINKELKTQDDEMAGNYEQQLADLHNENI